MTQPHRVDWEALKSEWRKRSTEKIRQMLCRMEIIPEDSLDNIHKSLKTDGVWLRAFQKTDGATLLAYFVFVWGMQTWEYTSDHADVRRKVADARNGYRNAYRIAKTVVEMKNPIDSPLREKFANYLETEQNLVHHIFDKFTIPVDLDKSSDANDPPESFGALLLDAMSVESSVYTGSTAATQKRALSIANLCDEILEVDQLKDKKFCDLFVEVLDAHRHYFGCIATAAEALHCAEKADLHRSSQSILEANSLLGRACDELGQAKDALGDDVYASELPAYRVAVDAWHKRLEEPPPSVHLNSLNITYIYPFTFPDIEGIEVKEFILTYGRENPLPTLCGLQPSKPEKLELTDMWTHGGRGDEINSTVVMGMPPLKVRLRGDEHAACTYNVEFRFNAPGNHYLRVDLELNSETDGQSNILTLNHVNQALRRSTVYSGEHRIAPDRPGAKDDQAWYVMTDFAKAVISDICEKITNRPKSVLPDDQKKVRLPWRRRDDIIGRAGAHAEATENKSLFNPDFDYRIVVAIHDVSELHGKQSDKAVQTAIDDAYGAVLLQLLGRETTTLDEWICWGRKEHRPNLLGDDCFPADFAMASASTTVLYMPSTPSWARSGYQEVAEFAASLPPVIGQSRDSLDRKLNAVDTFLQSDLDRRIDDQEMELDRQRSGIHVALQHLRKLRTYLVPSQLVSLRAEGSFLESLYTQSRLPELKEEIDGYLERGRAAVDRMNMREARLHDHRNRKYQDLVQILLFAVGTFSLSSVAALGLTLVYGANLPGMNTDDHWGHPFPLRELLIVVGLYLLAVFIGGLIYYLVRRTQLGTRKRRPRG